MFRLDTGEGLWNAVAFVLAFLVVLVIVKIIYWRGKKEQIAGGDYAVTPFLSGNPLPEDANIKADNLFWGFEKALKKYYDYITKLHSGIINDYVYWFVIVTAIVLLVMGGF